MINHLNNGLGAAQVEDEGNTKECKTVQRLHFLQWRPHPLDKYMDFCCVYHSLIPSIY